MAALLGGGMGYLIRQMQDVKGRVMALSDEVKAFAAEVGGQLDAAIEDIQKLHDILAASGDPDVPGAMAALDALRSKFAALKEKVDLPE